MRARAVSHELYLLLGHEVEDVRLDHLQLEEIMKKRHSGGNPRVDKGLMEVNK